jgi:anti-sigma B factor antagonist
MEIVKDEKDGVTILVFKGNLDTNSAPDAENATDEILETDTSKLVLDLSETRFVSSAGLRVFLATSKKMTAKGGSVVFCGANEVIQEIFDISGFSSILQISKTLEDAMESFK